MKKNELVLPQNMFEKNSAWSRASNMQCHYALINRYTANCFLETFCLANIGPSADGWRWWGVWWSGDGSPLNCFNKLPIVWILDKLSASRHGACNHSIRQFSGDLLTWTQVRTFITKCFSAKWANGAFCVVSINDDVGVSPGPSLSRVTIHVSRFCPVWQSLIESHIRRNKVQLNTRNARSWYNGAVSVKCRPGIRIWCSDTFLPLV